MLPIISYDYFPHWSIGPMIIFILVSILNGYFVIKYATARTFVGYSALFGALAGFIYNTIIMASVIMNANLRSPIIGRIESAFYIFYCIYIVFAFVPGLITFARISKRQQGAKSSKVGKYIVYVGHFWSALLIIIGLALTIMAATTFRRSARFAYYRSDSIVHFGNLLMFAYYSNWGFVAIFLVLHGIYYGNLQGKARGTLITYSSLNIISTVVFVIVLNTDSYFGFRTMLTTVYVVLFILCDITVAAAFIIAVLYGHLWEDLKETLDGEKVELESSNDNGAAVVVEESTRI